MLVFVSDQCPFVKLASCLTKKHEQHKIHWPICPLCKPTAETKVTFLLIFLL